MRGIFAKTASFVRVPICIRRFRFYARARGLDGAEIRLPNVFSFLGSRNCGCAGNLKDIHSGSLERGGGTVYTQNSLVIFEDLLLYNMVDAGKIFSVVFILYTFKKCFAICFSRKSWRNSRYKENTIGPDKRLL